MRRIDRALLTATAACAIVAGGKATAFAADDPTFQNCMIAGNGYCGGPANEYPRPASWHGRFIVVRQGTKPRHVRMYFGVPHTGTNPFLERAYVGRIRTSCTPTGAIVKSAHNGIAYVRMCGRLYAHRFRSTR